MDNLFLIKSGRDYIHPNNVARFTVDSDDIIKDKWNVGVIDIFGDFYEIRSFEKEQQAIDYVEKLTEKKYRNFRFFKWSNKYIQIANVECFKFIHNDGNYNIAIEMRSGEEHFLEDFISGERVILDFSSEEEARQYIEKFIENMYI